MVLMRRFSASMALGGAVKTEEDSNGRKRRDFNLFFLFLFLKVFVN